MLALYRCSEDWACHAVLLPLLCCPGADPAAVAVMSEPCVDSHKACVQHFVITLKLSLATAVLLCCCSGADPAAVAVMMEDGAAVAGLFIAGGCLALCQVRC